MEIKANRKDLITALKTANACIDNRAIVPVLANAHIEVNGNQIAITCTSLEHRITVTCEAEVNGTGCTTIPAKKLLSVLEAMSDNTVSLNCDLDNFHTLVKCGSSKVKFLGLSAADFPEKTSIADGKKITFSMDTDDLRTLIDNTSYAIGVNESRKILNGMLFEAENNEINAVGTDSKRLAKASVGYVVPVEETAQKFQRIIPFNAISFLRTLKSEKLEIVFDADGKRMEVTAGDVEYSSKLIEGSYPNYRQVIPPRFDYKATIDRDTFLAKLNIISMIAGDDKYISLTFNENTLLMIAENSFSGKAEDEMPIELNYYNGEPLTVTINAIMLSSAVKASAAEKFVICYNNGLSPLEFDFSAGCLGIIMPVRK